MAIQGIGTGSSPNDGTGDNLRAAGGKINNNFSELYGYFGDGTTLSRGTWNIVSSGINTLSSVGIGTTNPRFTLEVGAVGASGTSLYVNGDARVTGILTVGSSSVTLNGSTNEITVGTGITISGNTGIISATQVTIAGETLTGAGVTSLVAGSNITLSGSTGQVTISSSGVSTDVGAGGTWSNYDGVLGVTTTKKVKIQNNLEVTGISTFSSAATFNSTTQFNNNSAFADDKVLNFGASSDGRIFFENSANEFHVRVPGGSGKLTLGAGAPIQITNEDGNTNRAVFDASGVSITGTSTCTGSVQVGSGQSFGSSTGSAAVYYGDGSNLTGISGGSGITTANISADTLEVSGVSTFTGNTITNGRVSIGAASAGSANLAIVNTNSASFSIGQNVDGSGANHLGIYYGTGLGSPAGADIFTSNGNMSFWVDGAGGGAGNSELEFGNAFGASGGAGGATWISMSSSGLSVSGIVTARTGAAVTYYGDASYITSGRWVLGANGSTDYTFTGPGFSGATNDPILYLARGQTYEFVNTMNAHPFQIRASNGGSAYNTGVTNNGTQNGTVKFEIPMDAPDTLYYQCTSHSGMGNTISVYPSTI